MISGKNFRSRLFDIINYTFLGLAALVTIYPFWATFVISLSPMDVYLTDNLHIIPRGANLKTYQYILGMKELWQAYGMTISITVIGTVLNVILTVMAGYALSKKHLKGRKILMQLIIFTMLFSGGIIPTYILIRSLGIMNTMWALIIPGAISTMNLIIMKNHFEEVPSSLEESAKIDGCNDLVILFRIIIPISLPVIATISLFYAVAHWNEFFAAVMYINDRKKWTLQLYLRAMLYEHEAAYQDVTNIFLQGMPLKMASVMVAVIPVVCLYPYLQKYFVKGALVGSIKA